MTQRICELSQCNCLAMLARVSAPTPTRHLRQFELAPFHLQKYYTLTCCCAQQVARAEC